MMLRVGVLLGLLACAYAGNPAAVEFITGGYMTIRSGCDDMQAEENFNNRHQRQDGYDGMFQLDKNDVLESVDEYCPGYFGNLTGVVAVNTPVKFGVFVDPYCKPLKSKMPVGEVNAVQSAELPGSGLTGTKSVDITSQMRTIFDTSGIWGDDANTCDPGCYHLLLGKSTDTELQVIQTDEFIRGGDCVVPEDLNVELTYIAGTITDNEMVTIDEDEHGLFFPLRAMVEQVGVAVANGPLPPVNEKWHDNIIIYYTDRHIGVCEGGDVHIGDTVLFEAKLGDFNSWSNDDIPEKVRIGSTENETCAFCGHGRIVLLWDYLHSRRADSDKCDNYHAIELEVDCPARAYGIKKTECFPIFMDQGNTAWCGMCDGPYRKIVEVKGGIDELRWQPQHELDPLAAMGVARIWQLKKRFLYPEVCEHAMDLDAKLTYMKDTTTPVSEDCKNAVFAARAAFETDPPTLDLLDIPIGICAAEDPFVSMLLSGFKKYMIFAMNVETMSPDEAATETMKLYFGDDFDPVKQICPEHFGNWEQRSEMFGMLIGRLFRHEDDGDIWTEMPQSACAYRMMAGTLMSSVHLIIAPDLHAEIKKRQDEERPEVEGVVEHLKHHVSMDYDFMHHCNRATMYKPKLMAPTYTVAKGNDIYRGHMSYWESGRIHMKHVGVFWCDGPHCDDVGGEPATGHNQTEPMPPTRK